ITSKTCRLVGNFRIDWPARNRKRGHEAACPNGQVTHASIKHHCQSYPGRGFSICRRRITRQLFKKERITASFFDDGFDDQLMSSNLGSEQGERDFARFFRRKLGKAQFALCAAVGLAKQRLQKWFEFNVLSTKAREQQQGRRVGWPQ